MASARPLVRSALLALLLAGVACSTDDSVDMVFDPDPDAGTDVDGSATFAEVQARILTPSCALAGCHSGRTFPDLSAGGSYATIVGRAGSQGLPLIDPGNPEGSYLYLKVTGAPGISGDRMPQGSPSLTQVQLDLLADWIRQGALND